MAILGDLCECKGGLQNALQNLIDDSEEVGVVAEITNLREAIAQLEENLKASKQAWEAEAEEIVSDGKLRFKGEFSGPYSKSIKANLTKTFQDQDEIAKELFSLASSDPDLLMAWAVTIRTRTWRHMTLQKYNRVIARLKSWEHPPWAENVLKTLYNLKETTLKDSDDFKTFYDHMQALAKASRGAPNQPSDARLSATSPSEPGVGLPTTSPSQPGVGLPAMSPSQPGIGLSALQPDARLPEMWPPQTGVPLPALAGLPNQVPFFSVLDIKVDSYRLLVQLPILNGFLPVLTVALNGVCSVPIRAEMLCGTEADIQSFVEIFYYQANWTYVLRIDLPPQIVYEINNCILRPPN